MENGTEISPEYQPPIDFQPPPPVEIEEEMMLAILNGIGIPGEWKPLQCVTFKQPLPEYFRLRETCQNWRLQYSDVIRDVLRKLIPVLESPNEAVREVLEAHRESEIEKDRLRKEARRKRAGLELAATLACSTTASPNMSIAPEDRDHNDSAMIGRIVRSVDEASI
jgi:hypothetical protein